MYILQFVIGCSAINFVYINRQGRTNKMKRRQRIASTPTHLKLSMQLNNQPAPSFSIFLHSLSGLSKDLFPFLTLSSATFSLIIIEIFAYIFLSPMLKTIKPYKGFNDLVPWILAPFFTQFQGHSLVQLVTHSLFLANVGAEVEAKMFSSTKFLMLYVAIVWISNIFVYCFWNPWEPITCGNYNTYSFYLYLQLLNPKLGLPNLKKSSPPALGQHQFPFAYKSYPYSFSYSDSQFGIQRNESLSNSDNEADRDQKVIGFYKFIILSYLVYLGNFQTGCSMLSYLISLGTLFLIAYWKIL